ncbi:MAG: DNA-directed RNA polymerase subunit alpha [Candidatus Melainabacteria bacterium RIFCSPHIGHO2_02_FULL_34_12]|nr:MAG: DNA-directed RNA polymerase subunit alpha [Candidatus Melainabacteria bacterium RIFCSPHIGHO2_02_FULL_34_12]
MSQVTVKCLENKTNNDGSLYGKFLLEPFERGFGTTVGNSLRRVLLSSTPGSAVTAVRIEGITHEFSSVPGVVEDVIDILLNLKGLAVKSFSDQPQTLRISAKGPAIVLGKDLHLPADVQIVNPDWKIATLSNNGNLNMEIVVENGVGYIPADKQKSQRPIDFIPVDAVFMPIKRVAYSIETARTPDGHEFDRLYIEIFSSGVIEPTVALGQAAANLIEKMATVAQFSGESISIPTTPEVPKVEEATDQRKTLSIEELELSVRAYNCLKRANINSLGELLSLSYNELMNIKNFGKKSADEVLERLHAMGLHLADEAMAANYQEGGMESEVFSA